MTKVQSYVILVLPNVTIELSNMRKQIKVLPNVTKVRLEVMLVLYNVRTKPLNVRKNKGTTEYDTRTVTYDVGTVQCGWNCQI